MLFYIFLFWFSVMNFSQQIQEGNMYLLKTSFLFSLFTYFEHLILAFHLYVNLINLRNILFFLSYFIYDTSTFIYDTSTYVFYIWSLMFPCACVHASVCVCVCVCVCIEELELILWFVMTPALWTNVKLIFEYISMEYLPKSPNVIGWG